MNLTFVLWTIATKILIKVYNWKNKKLKNKWCGRQVHGGMYGLLFLWFFISLEWFSLGLYMWKTKPCGSKELKKKWQNIWQMCKKKKKNYSGGKGLTTRRRKKSKHFIREVTQGEKWGKNDILFALNVDMWVWSWLKGTRGEHRFSSLILWMDPIRVCQREEKKNEPITLRFT